MTSERRESATEDATPDRLIRTLADEHCRRVLQHLIEDNSAQIGDLPPATTATTEVEQRRAAARLRHHYLPKLDQADLIAYDPERNIAELAIPKTTAADLLDRTDFDDIDV